MGRFTGSRAARMAAVLAMASVLPLATMTARAEPTGKLFITAGDIVERCSSTDPSKHAAEMQDAFETAAQVDAALAQEPDAPIALLGDQAYGRGTTREFTDCYEQAWGRFNPNAHPTPGNHEYMDDCRTSSKPDGPDCGKAAPYFAYFGAAAGDPAKGYYSWNYAGWHIVVLNTNERSHDKTDCKFVKCGPDSEQIAWLKADLAANPAECTLAYYHAPRFTSGYRRDSSNGYLDTIWQTLEANGVDVVLNGHEHHYERFTTMDGAGNADPDGMREFIVGTGGRKSYTFDDVTAPWFPTTEARGNYFHGVMLMRLGDGQYSWSIESTPSSRQPFSDSGSSACTNR